MVSIPTQPRVLRNIVVAALPILFASSALAKSPFDFQVGIAAGQRDIDYELSSVGSATIWRDSEGGLRPGFTGAEAKFQFDEPLYTAAFTGSAVYEDFYLSVYLETSIDEGDAELRTTTEPVPGPGIPLRLDNVTNYDLERLDYSITFGHRVWRGLSVFGGYRYTEFELNAQSPNILGEETDTKYTEEGMFLGASYTFRIKQAGALSFTLGYAFLDVDFSQSNITTSPPSFAFALQEFQFNASATGLSYGVTWTGNLSGGWAYTLSLKHQEYKSDDDATSQGWLLGENFPAGDPLAPYTSTDVQHDNVSSDHSDTTALVGVVYRF